MKHTASAPLWEATALGSGGTLTSPAIDIRRMTNIGLLLRVTNASAAADVSIHYAISEDGENFGAFDNVVCASTNTLHTGNNPEDWHDYVIAPVAAHWIKIKITEVGTNANNVVDSNLIFSEDIE